MLFRPHEVSERENGLVAFNILCECQEAMDKLLSLIHHSLRSDRRIVCVNVSGVDAPLEVVVHALDHDGVSVLVN